MSEAQARPETEEKGRQPDGEVTDGWRREVPLETLRRPGGRKREEEKATGGKRIPETLAASRCHKQRGGMNRVRTGEKDDEVDLQQR